MMNKVERNEKQVKKQKVSSYDQLNLYRLKNTESEVTCFGRPSTKDIVHFKNTLGINLVLTLQGEGEKPGDIQKACKENDVEWLHFPEMGAGHFTLIRIKDKLIKLYAELFSRMQKEKIKLFVHCAAGVHRTGVFLYGLIRLSGESPEMSYLALKSIRTHTYNHVGKERIEGFEAVVSKDLIKAYYGVEEEDKSKKELR